MTVSEDTPIQASDDPENASVVFTAPRTVEVTKDPLPVPAPDEVLVRSVLSGISAGSELLVFRGEAPAATEADATIEALSGTLAYPVQYGYSNVGHIQSVGSSVHEGLIGQRVFGFQPHTRWFCARPSALHFLSEETTAEDAIFLPNMETAVSLVMDAQPTIGGRLAVFGLGVVGLLTTKLLTRFPLQQLIVVDPREDRRSYAESWGVTSATPEEVLQWEREDTVHPFDVCIECSGAPDALDQAIQVCGFEAKVIVASWYGTKKTALNLGDRFHRQRLQLVSAQVSTVSSRFSSRWSKERRFRVAAEQLKAWSPSALITHTFPLHEAQEAYTMLDTAPHNADRSAPLQVAFTY